MKNETKSLFAALGIVAISGLVYVVNKPGLFKHCKPTIAACDFLVGAEYQRLEISAQACPTDAGDVEIVAESGNPSPIDVNACLFSEYKKGDYPRKVPFACAWAPNGGECDALGDGLDGGIIKMKAGAWVMQPGKFDGKDCVRRPCTEVFGIPWTP